MKGVWLLAVLAVVAGVVSGARREGERGIGEDLLLPGHLFHLPRHNQVHRAQEEEEATTETDGSGETDESTAGTPDTPETTPSAATTSLPSLALLPLLTLSSFLWNRL